jgi:antitoxin component YwqK of YwqJK toxin-antitoxin module
MACASLGSIAPMGLAGCGGEEASGVHAAKLPEGVRSEAVEHEACSESGHRVEILDANGDGKADIKRVYDKGTGKEICRITDLNHDGKPDLYEYYDANGTVRRREADYDDNGIVDSIDYYEGGKMVRREYDTTGQHRIDTWDYFDKDSGRHTRRERDTNNDGKVDQWWTWDGEKVTIATDKNGDGKPDPDTVMVLGSTADGGIGGPVAPPSASAPPGPPAPPTLDVKSTEPQQADNALLDAGASASDAGAPSKKKGR